MFFAVFCASATTQFAISELSPRCVFLFLILDAHIYINQEHVLFPC